MSVQLTPYGAVVALLLGYFSEYIDRGFGLVCCAFCRCAVSERFWVEQDDRRGICGRVDVDHLEEKQPEAEVPVVRATGHSPRMRALR
jgi:hypothetical protein